MNVKYLAKFVGSAVGAGSALRSFARARRDNDRLKMLDALISVASVALTVAIVVREIREEKSTDSRVIDLEDTK